MSAASAMQGVASKAGSNGATLAEPRKPEDFKGPKDKGERIDSATNAWDFDSGEHRHAHPIGRLPSAAPVESANGELPAAESETNVPNRLPLQQPTRRRMPRPRRRRSSNDKRRVGRVRAAQTRLEEGTAKDPSPMELPTPPVAYAERGFLNGNRAALAFDLPDPTSAVVAGQCGISGFEMPRNWIR